MDYFHWLTRLVTSAWGVVGGSVIVLAMTVSAIHAIMTKKHTRAAVGWVGLIWFAPGIGIVMYLLFGINRISRKAHRLREDLKSFTPPESDQITSDDGINDAIVEYPSSLETLPNLVGQLTSLPLTQDNKIDLLHDGNEAYERMISAIQEAEKSITLSTYIFDRGGIGEQFVEALSDAHDRGVETRVLIDDVGARYSFPPVSWKLKRRGIPTARFMNTWLPWRFRYLNLRNHRKVMVVDGRKGFTGGLNIKREYYTETADEVGFHGVHFYVDGPVVQHLQLAFAEDWLFAKGEELEGEPWFPKLEGSGSTLARGIADGPDEDFDRIRFIKMAALSRAEERVDIVTPYFIPDEELMNSMNLASMRGVEINIVIPETKQLRMVHWASMGVIEEVLKTDCNIYLCPPPFDHSKIMVVDGAWSFIGSSNWDSRSLKLNFEFNLECYDTVLADELRAYVDEKITRSSPLLLEDMKNKNYLVQLRNKFFSLFSPYL